MSASTLPRKCISTTISFREKKELLQKCQLKEEETRKESEALIFQVSNFVLKRQLGQGAGGRVFLGRHVEDRNRRAAIKIIHKRSSNAKAVRMARREHAILTELPPHPHIVHLFDVVENSKRLCLVMQYAEGGDLFDYVLKSGKLPQHEAWRIFRQLLDAVNHIHKHGFMHRDIKPENIFLDKDLNVVLGDFGLGGKWSSLSPTNATCGSLNYAAPEILGANYYIGPEVDLWSCGAVLYMMLTGSVPFSAESTADVYENIRTAAIQTPSFLDKDVVDLMHKLLTPHSLKRATMMDVLKHPWLQKLPHRVRSRTAPNLGAVRVQPQLLPTPMEDKKEKDRERRQRQQEMAQKESQDPARSSRGSSCRSSKKNTFKAKEIEVEIEQSS